MLARLESLCWTKMYVLLYSSLPACICGWLFHPTTTTACPPGGTGLTGALLGGAWDATRWRASPHHWLLPLAVWGGSDPRGPLHCCISFAHPQPSMTASGFWNPFLVQVQLQPCSDPQARFCSHGTKGAFRFPCQVTHSPAASWKQGSYYPASRSQGPCSLIMSPKVTNKPPPACITTTIWEPLTKWTQTRKTNKCISLGHTAFIYSPAPLWINQGARATDFSLPQHLCFCLPAASPPLWVYFFDCSSWNILLPTKHLIPPGALAQLLPYWHTALFPLLTWKFPCPIPLSLTAVIVADKKPGSLSLLYSPKIPRCFKIFWLHNISSTSSLPSKMTASWSFCWWINESFFLLC